MGSPERASPSTLFLASAAYGSLSASQASGPAAAREEAAAASMGDGTAPSPCAPRTSNAPAIRSARAGAAPSKSSCVKGAPSSAPAMICSGPSRHAPAASARAGSTDRNPSRSPASSSAAASRANTSASGRAAARGFARTPSKAPPRSQPKLPIATNTHFLPRSRAASAMQRPRARCVSGERLETPTRTMRAPSSAPPKSASTEEVARSSRTSPIPLPQMGTACLRAHAATRATSAPS
ncbi:hypothetical protein BN3658_00126 [Coriobacteriaceae bacterium CHKCI002]|nr:hypothetical protein BN3658_00126 [Coriobacteriaceae bacterium CHKCI002]